MIKYRDGDATLPQSNNPTIICHSCNNLGVWGAGFVVPLGRRYPQARQEYLKWAKIGCLLGEVQFVEVGPLLWVANIIGQEGVISKNNPHPVSYEALKKGFTAVADYACVRGAEVVMPRIGCGLGGGSWREVEKVLDVFTDRAVSVWVVTLPTESSLAGPNVR